MLNSLCVSIYLSKYTTVRQKCNIFDILYMLLERKVCEPLLII